MLTVENEVAAISVSPCVGSRGPSQTDNSEADYRDEQEEYRVSQPFPQVGDVVITRKTHSPETYELSTVPGPAQFRNADRETAIQHGQHCAARARVDLWLTTDGTEYTLLRRFR